MLLKIETMSKHNKRITIENNQLKRSQESINKKLKPLNKFHP